MTENLVSRVKRIISGGLFDIVETIETAQGESVMREAIREVERAIDDARTELGRAGAKRFQATRQIAATRAKLAELDEKARFAVAQSRNDLAEAMIARQVDLEAQIPVLEAIGRDAQSEETEIERCLAALLGRKREMEGDFEAFMSARRIAESAAPAPRGSQAAGADSRAERAFNAFERARKGARGVTGVTPTDVETSAKLAELEIFERQKTIADRLAALTSPPDSPRESSPRWRLF